MAVLTGWVGPRLSIGVWRGGPAWAAGRERSIVARVTGRPARAHAVADRKTEPARRSAPRRRRLHQLVEHPGELGRTTVRPAPRSAARRAGRASASPHRRPPRRRPPRAARPPTAPVVRPVDHDAARGPAVVALGAAAHGALAVRADQPASSRTLRWCATLPLWMPRSAASRLTVDGRGAERDQQPLSVACAPAALCWAGVVASSTLGSVVGSACSRRGHGSSVKTQLTLLSRPRSLLAMTNTEPSSTTWAARRGRQLRALIDEHYVFPEVGHARCGALAVEPAVADGAYDGLDAERSRRA